jgi:iron complex transport system substrate-binding protein
MFYRKEAKNFTVKTLYFALCPWRLCGGKNRRGVVPGFSIKAWLQFTGRLLLLLPVLSAGAEIRVVDDAGTAIVLEQPVRRIVSLAPHITELLFAAGAGDYVVGAPEFSDYPAAARTVPRIGGGNGLDIEAILALRPELVIAWESGNPAAQISRLRQLGLRVFLSEPRRLEDVPATMERLGRLAGTTATAARRIEAFNDRYRMLRQHYAGKPPVRVFYQAWERPLMTVNGAHLISDVIGLCGGRNVFAGLPGLAPQLDIEAVIAADPEVIVAGSASGAASTSLDAWRRWSGMAAVRKDHLYTVPWDLLARHTPRILDGAERLCRILETVRSER